MTKIQTWRMPKSQRVGNIIKTNKMKKLAFISGALFASLITIGFILKTLHLPFAGELLGISGLLFAFIVVPSVTKYLYDKEK
jgi:hypothetical protein